MVETLVVVPLILIVAFAAGIAAQSILAQTEGF
jgi:hypothetical protein